ncbi:3-phosphoshikimate 1-carboxyvinyltransferase [Mucilaginibacter sp. MD40]|uniref:3-phosphoshikimate 1-carboxyvinyltransferase n=1 Tax=Mucilaginibacter sp. MD40 TaxID=2029590 RepID=UPI000BAC7868|nr:3-phosphoshikimate 1-carboxyvinyltransferase [Mucilaginibacter sp. MD40]PAW92076.1 3-phosphoshikimate 1-carboxyvinyltransferase [Mucilaginibacter sp. MD40]
MAKHNIILTKQGNTAKGTIQLTGSKSECNRALILEALSDGEVKVENISDAADAVTLKSILDTTKMEPPQLFVQTRKIDEHGKVTTSGPVLTTGVESGRQVDVGPAGTAMRFLTAYLPLLNKNVTLTGSARMQQRPIGILVDAMRKLGATIDYVNNEGYPPIHIHSGFEQQTNAITIKGDISSQYITALLLIAPKLSQGLELHIEGELTSKPYVEMTLAMLNQTGIRHSWADNVITIQPQDFTPTTLYVEPDWSAASYWYAIAALSDEAELFLPGLTPYSLQGDSVITEIMANFGITSVFKGGGVYLTKEAKPIARKIFDMKECPDLAQTVIVVCAALGHEATFTGLETLKIKETDRVLALQTELAKMGVKLIEKGQVYKLDCSERNLPQHMFISTYDDHRMAMAFAPLAILIPELEVEDAEVVNKSYPAFWTDLEKVGFKSEPLS